MSLCQCSYTLHISLEAFKRYHKPCKAKEKELPVGRTKNMCELAGEGAERKRCVIYNILQFLNIFVCSKFTLSTNFSYRIDPLSGN